MQVLGHGISFDDIVIIYHDSSIFIKLTYE